MKPSDLTARVSKPISYEVTAKRRGGNKRNVHIPTIAVLAGALRAYGFGPGQAAMLNVDRSGQWYLSPHAIVPATYRSTYLYPDHGGVYKRRSPDNYKAAKSLLEGLRADIAKKAGEP